MENTLKVAAIQMKVPSKDKEENIIHALDLLDRCSSTGARMMCLPELFSTPYFAVVDAMETFELAETIPGPTTDTLSQRAKKLNAYIAGSIFERDRLEHLYYNCAFLIDPRGVLIGKYRKMHIPFVNYEGVYINEKYYFRPGDLGFPVFPVEQLKVGLLICYDRSFPEAWRCLALKGAGLVLVPTASSSRLRWKTWEIGLRTKAVENHLFVVGCNRGGEENFYRESPLSFFGNSLIASPLGDVLAKAGSDEEIISAELNFEDLRASKQRNFFFHDWRPEAYDVYHRNVTATPWPTTPEEEVTAPEAQF